MKDWIKGCVWINAEAGFNIVRAAAIGRVEKELNGNVDVDFPLIDLLAEKSEEEDIAFTVRLQGYSLNLSGYDDTTMLNERGDKMFFNSGAFVRDCVSHPGVIKDNEDATRVSAAHFSKFPSLVGFQIYNEPAFPFDGYYDYNPHSIAYYKKWLVERGIKDKESADATEPPRHRPGKGESIEEWINWRLFNQERLNWFLAHLGRVAQKESPSTGIFTCHMPCPNMYGSAVRAVDHFYTAEHMDLLGMTYYIHHQGAMYSLASMNVDFVECAAATFNKKAWVIECNANVNLPIAEWERTTYNVIGSGMKGIMYYSWRGDYYFEDWPRPGYYGVINNDRTKTEKYPGVVKMNKLINNMSSYFACSDKLRSGVAILYSDYTNAYFDAIDNTFAGGAAKAISDELNCSVEIDPQDEVPAYVNYRERSINARESIYIELKHCGVTVDITRACDLKSNPLGVKLLIVP